MHVRRHRALVILAALAGALAACQQPPLACGVYPTEGGPAVVRTRDQQLCELVRQRVMQFMGRSTNLTFERVEQIAADVPSWRRADTLEDLVVMVREDAGDELADLIVKAIASIDGPAGKPLPTTCDDIQECLVDGAVKGAELGFAQRGYYIAGGRPESDAVHPASRGRIDIEDLSD